MPPDADKTLAIKAIADAARAVLAELLPDPPAIFAIELDAARTVKHARGRAADAVDVLAGALRAFPVVIVDKTGEMPWIQTIVGGIFEDRNGKAHAYFCWHKTVVRPKGIEALIMAMWDAPPEVLADGYGAALRLPRGSYVSNSVWEDILTVISAID